MEWKEKENNTWRKNKKVQGIAGLTQKAVGERVGFSIGTQDSRIRKYEKDMMAPKEDIRIKIAEAVLIVLIIGVVAIRFFIIRSKPAYLKNYRRQYMMRRQCKRRTGTGRGQCECRPSKLSV